MYKVWCETAEALDAEISKHFEDFDLVKIFSRQVVPIGLAYDGTHCTLVSRELYDAINLPELEPAKEKPTIESFISYANGHDELIECFKTRGENVVEFHDKKTNRILFRFDWGEGFIFTDCEDLLCGFGGCDCCYIEMPETNEALFKEIMRAVAKSIGDSTSAILEVMKYGSL